MYFDTLGGKNVIYEEKNPSAPPVIDHQVRLCLRVRFADVFSVSSLPLLSTDFCKVLEGRWHTHLQVQVRVVLPNMSLTHR